VAALIGFAGNAGAGKDTAGAHLRDAFGFELRSFAAPLKRSVAALLGVSVGDLERWKNVPAILVEVIDREASRVPRVSMTVREFLQRYGTEAHREVFGDAFWVNQSLSSTPLEDVAFTDVRFANEARAIRRYGGAVVWIERTEPVNSHVSEAGLSAGTIDFVVENRGTVDELRARLDDLVWSLR
jgi:hypothetical protein